MQGRHCNNVLDRFGFRWLTSNCKFNRTETMGPFIQVVHSTELPSFISTVLSATPSSNSQTLV